MAGETVLIEFSGMLHLPYISINFIQMVFSHPNSVDALCAVPSSYPESNSTILTGSSDGLVRAVQVLPTKLLGVIVDHGTFPVERIAMDYNGEGNWVGSVGHDEVLRMTDLRNVLQDENGQPTEEEDNRIPEKSLTVEVRGTETAVDPPTVTLLKDIKVENEVNDDDPEQSDSHASEDGRKERKKRKREKKKDSCIGKAKKGRNQIDAEAGFFSEL